MDTRAAGHWARELDAALLRPDLRERALGVGILACRIFAAHRAAIGDRDTAATALTVHHGWAATDAAGLISRASGDRQQIADNIAAITATGHLPPAGGSEEETVEAVTGRAENCRALWDLWTRAYRAAEDARADATGAPAPGPRAAVPGAARLIRAAQRATRARRIAAVAERNQVAKALVEYQGWPSASLRRIIAMGADTLHRIDDVLDGPGLPERFAALVVEVWQLDEYLAVLADALVEAVRRGDGAAELAALTAFLAAPLPALPDLPAEPTARLAWCSARLSALPSSLEEARYQRRAFLWGLSVHRGVPASRLITALGLTHLTPGDVPPAADDGADLYAELGAWARRVNELDALREHLAAGLATATRELADAGATAADIARLRAGQHPDPAVGG